jgi:hypothetical protein
MCIAAVHILLVNTVSTNDDVQTVVLLQCSAQYIVLERQLLPAVSTRNCRSANRHLFCLLNMCSPSIMRHVTCGLCLSLPSLQIDNPEQYNFRPKWLLVQICTIYLHMSAADRGGKFAAAVAADKRSYRPEMFAEASMILRQLGLMPELQVGRRTIMLHYLSLCVFCYALHGTGNRAVVTRFSLYLPHLYGVALKLCQHDPAAAGARATAAGGAAHRGQGCNVFVITTTVLQGHGLCNVAVPSITLCSWDVRCISTYNICIIFYTC